MLCDVTCGSCVICGESAQAFPRTRCKKPRKRSGVIFKRNFDICRQKRIAYGLGFEYEHDLAFARMMGRLMRVEGVKFRCGGGVLFITLIACFLSG